MHACLGRRRALVAIAVIVALAAGIAGSGLLVSAQVTIDCAESPAPTAPADASPTGASPEGANRDFPADGGDLTVFAAASLSDVFEQISADIQAQNPAVTITFNFAGSQALVTQLSEGAAADVFASASQSQMTAAIGAGVIEGEPSIFAQNELVIIVPADNPAGIETAADLGNPGVLLVTAQEGVPVGQYTRQLVCAMAQDVTTYGDDFASRVAANVVSEEENVRAVATKVSLGEADAGVVYATDVTPDVVESVEIIPIPAGVNVVAEYPIAAVSGGDAALAEAFIDYVLSSDGQATLAEFGFLPAP
jgi:molybdate transport system substrate-binding protein